MIFPLSRIIKSTLCSAPPSRRMKFPMLAHFLARLSASKFFALKRYFPRLIYKTGAEHGYQ